jgi:hypothetical protein
MFIGRGRLSQEGEQRLVRLVWVSARWMATAKQHKNWMIEFV